MTDSSDSVPAAFRALRADAAGTLRSWHAPTAQSATTRDRMLQTLEADPAAMWRDGGPVHFTAGLILLSPDHERVALTLHRKARRWFQFGGHFEAEDDSVREAAIREGREESGNTSFTTFPNLLQVDAHDLPGAFGTCRTHLDLRFAAVARTDDLVVSDESVDVRWWPVSALPDGGEPSLQEAVDLAVARAQRPSA